MKQNKEFKSTTLSGQIVVSKTESGWNMVQMLPDNPCLKLAHSSLSFGWDEKCRFIMTGPMDQLEEFVKWLSTESQQAIEFLKMLIETEQQMFKSEQPEKEAEV